MAEKLLESAAKQQKNAFQFDTDTPKRAKFAAASQSRPNSGTAAELVATVEPTESKKLADDKSSITNSMVDSGIGLGEVQLRKKNQQTTHTNKSTESSSNSDDNGGFITPPDEKLALNRNQVKRATVVENPMFSSSPESELSPSAGGPNESLGLDDLDMDYEQIMHYFDNLKVRRFNGNNRSTVVVGVIGDDVDI